MYVHLKAAGLSVMYRPHKQTATAREVKIQLVTLMDKIKLRPYQEECIEKVNNLPDGTRTIVCLATGLGKTVTAAGFRSEGRVLWLSHRDELVRQPEKYFSMLGKSYGIEKAEEESNGEDVISASIQTISRDKRLYKFKEDEFSLIICDEAQHAAAKTYRKVLGYFKPKKLIGLTATPKRGDNARLTDVFDDICFVRDLKWGIENGYLSRIRCIRISAKFDVKKIKTAMGDLTASSMQAEMLNSDDDIVVSKAYLEYSIPEHKKTLIYCPTLKVCDSVYEAMKDMLSEDEIGKVKLLSDKTPAADREQILNDYKDTDKVNCIINCMILTEGTDLPQTSVVINNRPTANTSLYQQIIGRGTRLAEGKEYCLIIDIVGKNSAVRNLCSAPTLFGINPDELPESIEKKLYEGDLLEIAADIKENKAEKAKAILLRKEFIDIFTGQCLKIIEDNKDEGLEKIAAEYEKHMCPEGNKYDFGDLVVKTGADDDKYYCIPVTYNGNIYISKPDMLEKSRITVDIPRTETLDNIPWEGTSSYIPITAAIETVKMIVQYGISDKYKHRWSKSIRENMKHTPATDKQKEYIKSLYKDAKDKDLNKLEASNLIDLKNEINAMKEESRKLSYAYREAERKDKENKQKKLSAEYIKQEAERLERNKKLQEEQRHGCYRIIIKKCADLRDDHENSLRDMIEDQTEKKITVTITGNYGNMVFYPASKKQVEYLKSLIQKAEKKGFVREDVPAENHLKLNMYNVGFFIKLYKEFENMPDPPKGYEYYVKISEFIEKVREISPPVTSDTSIECRYLLRQEQVKFEEVKF